MKIKQKKKAQLTFGDLVVAAYRFWGAGRAANMVQLAISARLVVFRENRENREKLRFLISPAKGRSV